MTAPLPSSTWTATPDAPRRVLIVDDSVVVRTVLERILAEHPPFVVAHKTGNAAQALAFLEHNRVDIVLLDVEMPGQSGLAALPAILKAGQGAKVIILSGRCEEGSAAAVEALALGASDILSKPGSGAFGSQFGAALISRLMRIMGLDTASPLVQSPVQLRAHQSGRRLACIGVGASTGGIHALGQLLQAISTPPGVPILLTQHLPPSFMPFFATQLSRMTRLPVKLAEHGEELRPNTIYVAPGEANLELRKSVAGRPAVMLTHERAASGSLPGVDPMFASMAEMFGAGSLGIVLTGMGRDGTAGGRRIVEQGGWIVAQDQATSIVWGMPGSVARAGLTTALMPPQDIMPYVAQRAAVHA